MRKLTYHHCLLTAIVAQCAVVLPTQIHAQSIADRSFIETIGAGVVRVDFDMFTMQVSARGTASTRGAALAAASANADKLRETLGRIQAIAGYKITGTQPSIAAIGPGCADYGTQNCVPTNYNATILYTIAASPASGAGAALVVLEEQGFEAQAPFFSLSDTKAGAVAARRLAFENAKSAADVAATTAGCTRGKLLTITLDRRPVETEQVIVTGSRGGGNGQSNLRPSFNLSLEAGKARLEAQVGTRFELICR